MFVENKYSKVYYKIVDRAKVRQLEGYSERHHIHPEALGGSNLKSNIVRLTGREHFLCHQLLVRFTVGDAHRKMSNALWFFLGNKKHRDLNITSRKYETMKKLKSIAASVPQDPAVVAKRAAAIKAKGHKRSEDQLVKMKAGQKAHYDSQTTEQKMARVKKGTWARVKTFKVEDVNGNIHQVTNIQEFSKRNNIKGTALYKTEIRKNFANGYRIVGRV